MIEIIEIILIGIALSMDALAVSLALGAVERGKFTWNKILWTALFFGGFQALMPTIGWFGGSLCGEYVRNFGRIIAAVLLFWIGGKMIWDRNKEEKVEFGWWKLTVLAFATSIDALLVGVSFACLGRVDITKDVLLIGLTTFLISAAGCIAGRISGKLFGNHCELVGGLVLIAIGIKILFFG